MAEDPASQYLSFMGDGGWAAIRIPGLEGLEYRGDLLRIAEECGEIEAVERRYRPEV